jgi:hypothetical protein
MKKFVILASLVLSAVSTASSFAQPSDDPLQSLDSFIVPAAVKIGMSRDEVVAQLGAPSQQIGPSLWAYWNHRALGRPVAERHNALVVVFTNHKVSVLRLTERAHVEKAVAQVRLNAAKASTIAKK